MCLKLREGVTYSGVQMPILHQSWATAWGRQLWAPQRRMSYTYPIESYAGVKYTYMREENYSLQLYIGVDFIKIF